MMSNVPIGADAGREHSRRCHCPSARVLDASYAAVSLEGAADEAQHGIECLDRWLVQGVEDAKAERRTRSLSLAVRSALRGELLSPDRWLADRNEGGLATQNPRMKCNERPDQKDAHVRCADHGGLKSNVRAPPNLLVPAG